MADEVEQGERNGLSRRQMIKASAIAGAAAWTAPVIIDSLASPAAAVLERCALTACSRAIYVLYMVGRSSPRHRLQDHRRQQHVATAAATAAVARLRLQCASTYSSGSGRHRRGGDDDGRRVVDQPDSTARVRTRARSVLPRRRRASWIHLRQIVCEAVRPDLTRGRSGATIHGTSAFCASELDPSCPNAAATQV